jgi:hypothetical protein
MSGLDFAATAEKGQGGHVWEAVAGDGAVWRLVPWKYSDRRGWRIVRDGAVVGSRATKSEAAEEASAMAGG